MPFKQGVGKQPYNLTENDIRYAHENTRTGLEASRFLRVAYDTYKRYAKQYIDRETGISLFELHKNQSGKGTRKHTRYKKTLARESAKQRLQRMLDGEIPFSNIVLDELKKRLIKYELLHECCSQCGFNERRITDNRMPLLLDYIDGNRKNITLENLRLLCYNCYFLEVNNLHKFIHR